jgi:hypothetical protein
MKDEMESLNLDELDVEELEQRLELAAASPFMKCTSLVVCTPVGNPAPCSWD